MDEHRWNIPSGTATADRLGIKVNGPTDENYIVGGTICNEEILRLAGRNEELESLKHAEQEEEIALLRRERALLVALEKARAGIINGLLHGAVQTSLVEDVHRLNAEVAAVHLEASGGILRAGSACACLLCLPDIERGGTRQWTPAERAILRRGRSEGDQKQVGQEVQVGGSPGQETAGPVYVQAPGPSLTCGSCLRKCSLLINGDCWSCAARITVPQMEPCTACGEERETFEGRCHDCISAHRRGEG